MRIQSWQCFHHVNWKPGKKDLRQFGLAMLTGFFVLGAIALLRAGEITAGVRLLWTAGIVLFVLSFVPRIGPITYWFVNISAAIAGFCVSRIALALTFLFIVTPIGVLLRLLGRDLLQLSHKASGWVPLGSRNRTSYYRQF